MSAPHAGARAWMERRRLLSLGRALLGRLLFFLLTVCGAVGFVLVLLWAAPGDPIDLLPNGDEVRPVLEREWGLDRPVPARYVAWLSRAAQGDLGTSVAYRPGTPVTAVIAAPAARSLAWGLAAVVLSLLAGTALAWWTAARPRTPRRFVQIVSLTPLFLLAHAAVHTANSVAWWAIGQGYIDRPAWFALPDQPSLVRTALAITLLAVGSGALAEVHADVEDALVRIRRSGFVDAARARGAPTWPHVAWNLVPPLAAVATGRVAFFVGGLVILEKVLLLNGIGTILWQAALLRDYNVALGITIVFAAVVAATRLVGDLVRLAVDPRLTAEVGT